MPRSIRAECACDRTPLMVKFWPGSAWKTAVTARSVVAFPRPGGAAGKLNRARCHGDGVLLRSPSSVRANTFGADRTRRARGFHVAGGLAALYHRLGGWSAEFRHRDDLMDIGPDQGSPDSKSQPDRARPLKVSCHFLLVGWQGQQGSNPRPAVLETAALPTELYPYRPRATFHKAALHSSPKTRERHSFSGRYGPPGTPQPHAGIGSSLTSPFASRLELSFAIRVPHST